MHGSRPRVTSRPERAAGAASGPPDRLRQARWRSGLSKSDLANRIGLPEQAIRDYEDYLWLGKREVPFLRRWAQVCGVDEEWLISGTDPGARDLT